MFREPSLDEFMEGLPQTLDRKEEPKYVITARYGKSSRGLDAYLYEIDKGGKLIHRGHSEYREKPTPKEIEQHVTEHYDDGAPISEQTYSFKIVGQEEETVYYHWYGSFARPLEYLWVRNALRDLEPHKTLKIFNVDARKLPAEDYPRTPLGIILTSRFLTREEMSELELRPMSTNIVLDLNAKGALRPSLEDEGVRQEMKREEVSDIEKWRFTFEGSKDRSDFMDLYVSLVKNKIVTQRQKTTYEQQVLEGRWDVKLREEAGEIYGKLAAL